MLMASEQVCCLGSDICLQGRSATAKQQVDDDDAEHDAQSAPTVVAEARTHVVATAACQKKKHDKNEY